MTRKRSSWGSNQSMGQGKRRIRYMADTGDGRGYIRHSETVYGTRKQADEVLAQRRIEHSSDKPVPTLRQAYEAWYLPEMLDRLNNGELAHNSFEIYTSRWRRIQERFSDVPVTGISPMDIQEWLLSITPSTAGQSLQVLKHILDKCVLLGMLASNPARAAYRLPQKTSYRDKSIYTLSELLNVLDGIQESVSYIPAILCGIGSCRVGESLGVLTSEIQEKNVDGLRFATFDLVRQVDNGGHVIDHLKTAQSRRPIIIPEPWCDDIFSIKDKWLCDKGYGEPISQRVTRECWGRDLKKKNLPFIPFRNLRNSWRTIMRWELGIDPDYVEKMMGHAGKSIGEIYYDRPQSEAFMSVSAKAWLQYRAEKH